MLQLFQRLLLVELVVLLDRSSRSVFSFKSDEVGWMVSFCRKSLGLALGLVLSLGLTGCKFGQGSLGYNKGYSPDQPIPFSHELHTGKHQIQCTYCHSQVERSAHASIPALSTCMNCHVAVKTDSPYIQQMREAYDAGKSIEWLKVHLLPDHVKFNHSAHVNKGVNCNQCHGEVEKMSKVTQVEAMSMGWCVNCHRAPESKAPINCSTCHH